jgi:hypothetical protein
VPGRHCIPVPATVLTTLASAAVASPLAAAAKSAASVAVATAAVAHAAAALAHAAAALAHAAAALAQPAALQPATVATVARSMLLPDKREQLRGCSR